MRLTATFVTAVSTILAFFAFSLPSAESEMQTLTLPVEVMHYDVFGEIEGNSELPFYGGNSPRYVKEVTFDVSGSPGELWLWGHQIGFQYFWDHFEWQQGAGDVIGGTVTSDYDAPYDGRAKASVRINGGSWIDITNDNVTCASPEEEQFCIGGLAPSTRFKINGSQLQEGSNTVEFAFLGHEMLSSGYRILDIVALPAGYDGSLSHRDVRPVDLITNNKVMDYLDTNPPEGSDAQAGETLWNADNSLLDFPGGPEIIASCNDCHAQNGRDLEFFGYSNESIAVRSQHHGLTQQEGENIAAFIRSQDLTDENGVSYSWRSRPWHPPYQPGPRGFGPNNEHPDVAPQQYWAGGAGLEWVADADDDVLMAYLFPDGTANHDAGPFVQPPGFSYSQDKVNFDGVSPNVRDVPLAIQLPDWNRWLPIIHPRDAMGDDWFFEFPGRPEGDWAWPQYLETRANATAETLRQFNRKAIRQYRRKADDQPTLQENQAWNRVETRTARGGAQFVAVKMWELHHEFGLEDVTQDTGGGWTDDRHWRVGTRNVFDVASHITSDQSTMDGPPVGKAGEGLTHMWYHLQVVLTPNFPDIRSAQTPVDWAYQLSFSRAHDDVTGLAAPTRWMTTFITKDQSVAGRLGLKTATNDKGWDGWRDNLGNFARFWSQWPQNTNALSTEVGSKVVSGYLSAWIRFARQNEIEDFPRASKSDDNRAWGLPEDRPELKTPRAANEAGTGVYSSLTVLDESFNLNPTTSDSIAQWGSEMWSEPVDGLPGWETWFLENLPAFGLSMAGGSSQVAPASVTLTADPGGTPDEVRFYQNDVLIDTRTSSPWETAVSGLSEGTYTFRAESQIGQDVFESGQRTLNVEAAWVRENLNPRARGAVTGALNLLPDYIQLEATGTDSGLRRKIDPQQFEAVETCELGEEWEFSFADVTGNTGPWSRVGIQVENTGSFANAEPDEDPRVGQGFEMWSAEYLPLQRRMRVLYADPDRSWFSQEHNRMSITSPVQGRVSIEDAGPVANIRLEYDSTGDGAFDRNLTYTLDTLIDECEISLVATSRSSGQQIEALFTLEKVE